jgi:hypothetical protein
VNAAKEAAKIAIANAKAAIANAKPNSAAPTPSGGPGPAALVVPPHGTESAANSAPPTPSPVPSPSAGAGAAATVTAATATATLAPPSGVSLAPSPAATEHTAWNDGLTSTAVPAALLLPLPAPGASPQAAPAAPAVAVTPTTH